LTAAGALDDPMVETAVAIFLRTDIARVDPSTDQRQRAFGFDDLKDSPLVIIPCSGRKAWGSRRVDVRDTLLNVLPADCRAIAAIATVNETTLTPAWLRYAGTLYQSAFGADADVEATPPFRHLLILSGAYGVVRATDAIGTYDLAMKEARWLRGLLQEVIETYASRQDIRCAIALVSETTDYAKILRRVDWKRAGVTVAVLLTPEASAGAMVKARCAIGERLRALSTAGIIPSWRSSGSLGMIVRRLT
jgi:hypothetical protein